MNTLFHATVGADDIPSIPGLSYWSDYLTRADEIELVEAIDGMPWDTAWKRRRQPYGTRYGAGGGPEVPMPSWGLQLVERLLLEGVSDQPFDHMLVNEYEPGQGIALHRDYEPFDRTVVAISLLSACVMDFRHPETGRRERLLLEPRSLLVLSDEARYDWQHGIAPRKTDLWHDLRVVRKRRLSVTFRRSKGSGRKPHPSGPAERA